MKSDSNLTHKQPLIDPQTFRDQSTGIGKTLTASRITGTIRSALVRAKPAPDAQDSGLVDSEMGED